MNWSLRALETLSTGSLRFWGQRKAHLGDHVLFETLEPSEDHSWISNSRRVSDKQHDLLVRLKSFWEGFEKRYQALLGVTMDDRTIGSSVMRKFYKTGYAGASSDLTRGDVAPASLTALSLPSVDPISVRSLSPRLELLFSDWKDKMLVAEPPALKDLPKIYEDPLFASREGKLGLAKALYSANMIRFVPRQRGPAVKCFTVVKKVDPETGKVILRLIMDLRGTNAFFGKPPFCNLANASSFAYIELSEDVLEGGKLAAWGGDIPDFFYRLEIPPDMSEFFCLDGLTAADLCKELGLPPPRTLIVVSLCGWCAWAGAGRLGSRRSVLRTLSAR